jgi:hypothetical protein
MKETSKTKKPSTMNMSMEANGVQYVPVQAQPTRTTGGNQPVMSGMRIEDQVMNMLGKMFLSPWGTAKAESLRNTRKKMALLRVQLVVYEQLEESLERGK